MPIPPILWDRTMSRDRPAWIHGPTTLGAMTGGVTFGLSAVEVNGHLPMPAEGIDWDALPFANEYPEEVRYFWTRLDGVTDLKEGISGCTGTNSHVVFLFRVRGLFRVSWRLMPDAACPSTRAAAEGLYARYLGIDRAGALSTHYRAGRAEVVEITDPNAGYLIPYRWTNRQRR